MYDPNDEIMQRLAGRNRQGLFSRVKENVLNPSGDNVYKAAMILAGQKPQDDSNEKLATQIALLNYKNQLNPELNALKERDIESRIGLRDKIGTFADGTSDMPEGFTMVNGRLQRDPSYKRIPTPEERSVELNDEVAKNELTSMAKTLPKLDQADQAANQLESLYGQAVQPKSVKNGDVLGGLMYRAGQMPKTASALVGANPELNRYSANRKAFSGLISKGGFGEAGMLTENDINRIASILPNEYSTKEESDIAWKEIRSLLGSARKRFEEKKSQYTGGFGQNNGRTPSFISNSTSFNSPEEADSSGLPPGTIVSVNGRKYEIG